MVKSKFPVITLALVCTAIFAGCSVAPLESMLPSNEHENDCPTVLKTFSAGFDGQTKVALEISDNAGKVTWCAGDSISIWDGSNNVKVVLSKDDISADGATATFTVELAESDSYLAIFPYRSDLFCYGGDIYFSGPEEVQDGSFGSAHFAIAVENDGFLKFSPLGVILNFQISDPNVAKIVFYNNNPKRIVSGTVWAFDDYGDGDWMWLLDSGSYKISIPRNDTGDYYLGTGVSSYSYSFSDGFTIDLYNADEMIYGRISTDNDITWSTGTIIRLGSLEPHMTPASASQEFYNQTSYGIYRTADGEALCPFDRYACQTGKSDDAFWVSDPVAESYWHLSGLADTLRIGQNLTLTLKENISSDMSGQYKVTVGKIEGSKVWLYEPFGKSFIIKR